MRLFIKGWCMTFGVVAGMYLTLDGHIYEGLYIILLGLVLTVLEFQDRDTLAKALREKKIAMDILVEQFGRARSLQIVDEHFLSHGYVDQETIDKINAEQKREKPKDVS